MGSLEGRPALAVEEGLSIIRVFEQVTGKTVQVVEKVKHLFRTRDDPEVVPPTPHEVGPHTGDFVDGVIPADYMERRVKKAAAKASAEADGQYYIGGFDNGLHPGD